MADINNNKGYKPREGRREDSFLRRIRRKHNEREAAKKVRSAELASFIVDTYGEAFLRSGSGVLDVAGGKGSLAYELAFCRGIPCTVVDPRQIQFSKQKSKLILKKAKSAFDRGELKGCKPNKGSMEWFDETIVRSWSEFAASRDGSIAVEAMMVRIRSVGSQYLEHIGLRQRCCFFDESFCSDEASGTATLWQTCSVVVGMHPVSIPFSWIVMLFIIRSSR